MGITSGFSTISQKVCNTNMYNISLERCSYSASTRVNYIKIHVEIIEILQVKD